jgi:hypothetical protein
MYQSISRYSKPCHSSCSQGLIEDSGLAWATRLHWWIIRGLVVPCGWCAYASIRPLEAECLRSPHLLSGTGFGRQQAPHSRPKGVLYAFVLNKENTSGLESKLGNKLSEATRARLPGPGKERSACDLLSHTPASCPRFRPHRSVRQSRGSL